MGRLCKRMEHLYVPYLYRLNKFQLPLSGFFSVLLLNCLNVILLKGIWYETHGVYVRKKEQFDKTYC